VKRTCEAPECATLLSRFNQSAFCALHGGGPAVFDQAIARAGLIARAVAILHRPPEWADKAACRGMDTTRIFDVELPSDGTMTETVLRAKRICSDCPVRRECLEFAFEHDGVGAPPVDDEEVDFTPGRFADVVYGQLTGRQRMSLSQYEDRVERGMALAATERLAWWLDSVRKEEVRDA
jgi:hypothetical protein